MLSQYIAIGLVLVLSIVGHNMTVAYAAIIIIALKFLGLTTMLHALETEGLHWGIVLLTAAILTPLATGEITIQNMIDSFKTPLGIVAVIAGILAAVAGGGGVLILKEEPQVVSALVIGTMIGVFFFRGIAVGPLIAGGLTYAVMRLALLWR